MGAEGVAQLRQKLDRQEATTGQPGMVPRLPKQQLFNIDALRQRHPDKRLYWVNIRDVDSALIRSANGWVRLSKEEGGVHLGDEYAVFALPAEEAARRAQERTRLHNSRMQSYKAEYAQAIEKIARVLRDKHGIDIDADHLMRL